VLRNLGGSVGVALATTFLSRRSQGHQSVLAAHVNIWDPETAARLKQWTAHFAARGADSFTAERRATAMLYHDLVGQAQVLAYADDFWMLAVLFTVLPLAIPLMRRVRPLPAKAPDESAGRVEPLPSAVE
jgi:DHA2 family multidrug resistance protein